MSHLEEISLKSRFSLPFSCLFYPSTSIAESTDDHYRYWRWRIFYSIFFGYIFFYFTRKSLSVAMPLMITELGYTKTELGLLGSALYLSYGISKFTSGIMSDRSNPRYFMAIGLIITGILNIFFGATSNFMMFVIFWGLNGWFQGWGWPPCARLLSHWYSQSERGRWWAVWSTSHNIGGALILYIAAPVAAIYGWRFAFYVPAILSIGMGFVLLNRLRDTPQSLGLPSIEKFKNDYPSSHKKDADDDNNLSVKEILFKYVFPNKYLWLLALASFFVYSVRTGINDWGIVYLTQTKGYDLVTASICVSGFEWGGVAGMLAAGWISDLLFGGKRGPANVCFSVGTAAAVFLFWSLPSQLPIVDTAILFLIGFFLFGPQMLIGLAAVEFSHKKAAGTASGFAGTFAYFGAAIAVAAIGYITENWGWNGYFTSIFGSALMMILLFIPMWSIGSQSQRAAALKPARSSA